MNGRRRKCKVCGRMVLPRGDGELRSHLGYVIGPRGGRKTDGAKRCPGGGPRSWEAVRESTIGPEPKTLEEWGIVVGVLLGPSQARSLADAIKRPSAFVEGLLFSSAQRMGK